MAGGEETSNRPEREDSGENFVSAESDTEENHADLPEGDDEQGRKQQGGGKWPRKIFSGKKKFLPLLLLVLLLIGALGIKFGKISIENPFAKDDIIDLNLDNKDTLTEKLLSPFIVPLPPDSKAGNIVRIDFSIIWDGLASVRFENNKIQVRNQLYQFILDFGKNNKDLRVETDFLEKKMTGIVRQLLKVQNLAISIKEIRYL